jgi:hypothetical protein
MPRARQKPAVPTRQPEDEEPPWLPTDPYLEAWLALTPAERLRRAWRLRARLKDPQAVHDAKTLPEF